MTYYSMTITQFPFPSSTKLTPQPEALKTQLPVPSSLYPLAQAEYAYTQAPSPLSLNPSAHGSVVKEQAIPSSLYPVSQAKQLSFDPSSEVYPVAQESANGIQTPSPSSLYPKAQSDATRTQTPDPSFLKRSLQALQLSLFPGASLVYPRAQV